MPGAWRITFSMPQKQPPATIATSRGPPLVAGLGLVLLPSACAPGVQANSSAAAARVLCSIVMLIVRPSRPVGNKRRACDSDVAQVREKAPFTAGRRPGCARLRGYAPCTRRRHETPGGPRCGLAVGAARRVLRRRRGSLALATGDP